MASSFQQWEADPLFSAAEVVQDSADRVESIFRLILHEESLSKGYNPEMRLQHSIEYHRRGLATILETAKWQLEDFEREVNFLATADNSQEKQNVIYRHRQFVQAIREQIMNVEKSMEKLAVEKSARSDEWVDLSEQDRDGLASFLLGGTPVKNSRKNDVEGDANIFRKFLDPVGYSSITEEIAEQNSEISNMNELELLEPNLHLMDNELRKDGSEIDFEAPSTVENACSIDEGIYDLEANEAKPKTFFKQDMLRSYYSKINPFRSLRNLIPTYGSAGSRSITKRRKDGEEQRPPQSGNAFSHAIQVLLLVMLLSLRTHLDRLYHNVILLMSSVAEVTSLSYNSLTSKKYSIFTTGRICGNHVFLWLGKTWDRKIPEIFNQFARSKPSCGCNHCCDSNFNNFRYIGIENLMTQKSFHFADFDLCWTIYCAASFIRQLLSCWIYLVVNYSPAGTFCYYVNVGGWLPVSQKKRCGGNILLKNCKQKHCRLITNLVLF